MKYSEATMTLTTVTATLTPQTRLSAFIFAAVLLGFVALPKTAAAGTIVEVQTSVGTFYIEVNEEAAPITGGNFLNYVTSGAYNNTFIHGTTGGSLIRGGGYTYDSCTEGPVHTNGLIALENTGSPISMARWRHCTPSDANGATSEWFNNWQRSAPGYSDGGWCRIWPGVGRRA